jgi:recombination protein RecR
VSPVYQQLVQTLKKLPGLGARSAERIAIHLLAEKQDSIETLIEALRQAKTQIFRCQRCGNLSETELCEICRNPNRENHKLCIVESVSDLIAFESSGAWSGRYHVLNGKLSPIKGIGPEQLNLETLVPRIESEALDELLLALPNDIEGEATCHYIQDLVAKATDIKVSRIGFGLPSGGDIHYADANTLKNALEGRKGF